jgi:hypothetical protein
MKKLILLLFLLPLLVLGQTVNIDTTIELNPLYGGDGNCIITLENGEPFIVTKDYGNSTIHSTTKMNGSFLPFQDITPQSLNVSSIIMTNNGDSIYLLVTSGNNIYLIKSYDGGITFLDETNVSQHTVPYLIYGMNIELNSKGNPIVTYSREDANITELIVKMSLDRGETWFPETDVSNSINGAFARGAGDFIFHNDDIYILYQETSNDLTNNYSYIQKSTNFGLSFSNKTMINDSIWNDYPISAGGISGEIYKDSIFVVFKARNKNTSIHKLVKSSSHINNLNFTPNTRLTNYTNNISPFGDEKNPTVVVINDFLAVLYSAKIVNHKFNVYISYFQNNLSSFNAPIPISDINNFSETKLLNISTYNNLLHLSYFSGNGQAYQTYHQLSIDGITLGVNNINLVDKKISKIINILGPETSPKSNTPLFYLFDDGTVEKKIIVE